jgi:hypothetical protein
MGASKPRLSSFLIAPGGGQRGGAQSGFAVFVAGRMWADLIRPADSLDPGQTPAQDARRPGVSNTLRLPETNATRAQLSPTTFLPPRRDSGTGPLAGTIKVWTSMPDRTQPPHVGLPGPISGSFLDIRGSCAGIGRGADSRV